MSDNPLTRADLPRVSFASTDCTGAGVRTNARDATDRQFALWLRGLGIDPRVSVYWRFSAAQRVEWVNRVNDRKPIVLAAHEGEDGRL